MCRVCRGPARCGDALCFACRWVGRRLGAPLVPTFPLRLCPLPSPLYRVLMGYKESPVAEARGRFSAIVRSLVRQGLLQRCRVLEAAAGGAVDLVVPVPSSRRPGAPPLARVSGLGGEVRALGPGVRWAPELLRREATASPGLGHMQPDGAAFTVNGTVRGARVVLLDDTYVSGARAQSAATALLRGGVGVALVVPIGRVLRPDRSALHADFLRRPDVCRDTGSGLLPVGGHDGGQTGVSTE